MPDAQQVGAPLADGKEGRLSADLGFQNKRNRFFCIGHGSPNFLIMAGFNSQPILSHPD